MTNCQLLDCVASHKNRKGKKKKQLKTSRTLSLDFHFCSHLTIFLADMEEAKKGEHQVKREKQALVFQDARRAAIVARRKDSFVAKLSIHNE